MKRQSQDRSAGRREGRGSSFYTSTGRASSELGEAEESVWSVLEYDSPSVCPRLSGELWALIIMEIRHGNMLGFIMTERHTPQNRHCLD